MTLIHDHPFSSDNSNVSDACQINDFDHCGELNDFESYSMPVRSMTLTTPRPGVGVSDACQINDFDHPRVVLSMRQKPFQMPVRSMTLTTIVHDGDGEADVSDACQINDFDHKQTRRHAKFVSDACQINDFDHLCAAPLDVDPVSDACQINDFDHIMFAYDDLMTISQVSDACQINDFDH